jgi:hypothetical protein
MPNKQYTFSLPPEAGRIIDALPKMEKSECVAQALMQFEKEMAKQKTLDILALLQPKDWGTEKDAVTLVQEARQKRAGHLSGNTQ